MSHISKIEIVITSLDNLIRACTRLGFQFNAGQTKYRWYGRVIDPDRYPLPDGITEDQLGQCEHAISVPEAEYEIGVVKRDGKYLLLCDFWDSKLKNRIGDGGGRLKQAYAIEKTLQAARLKNYRVTEQRVSSGVRLILSA